MIYEWGSMLYPRFSLQTVKANSGQIALSVSLAGVFKATCELCKILPLPLCLGCRYPTFVHPKSSTKLLKRILSSEPNLSIVGPTCSLLKTRSPINNTLPSNTKIDLLVLQTLAQTPIHVKMYCYMFLFTTAV